MTHPNRKTIITQEQAQTALLHSVNRHFDNPGEKSRASIPAHQDDDDILLSDYISQREADYDKLWRISQAVKLQNQNDLAGLQQFYDYVKGVVGPEGEGGAT